MLNDNKARKEPEIFTTQSSTRNESFEADETRNVQASENNLRSPIDIRRNRFPYCIVWTPLPCISWILPFIGHTGICT